MKNDKHVICYDDNFTVPKTIYTPTLTSKCKYLFHTKYRRYLTYNECLLLQGFPTKFNMVVTEAQLHRQIGNSISVNVLKSLFKKLFTITTGFI